MTQTIQARDLIAKIASVLDDQIKEHNGDGELVCIEVPPDKLEAFIREMDAVVDKYNPQSTT